MAGISGTHASGIHVSFGFAYLDPCFSDLTLRLRLDATGGAARVGGARSSGAPALDSDAVLRAPSPISPREARFLASTERTTPAHAGFPAFAPMADAGSLALGLQGGAGLPAFGPQEGAGSSDIALAAEDAQKPEKVLLLTRHGSLEPQRRQRQRLPKQPGQPGQPGQVRPRAVRKALSCKEARRSTGATSPRTQSRSHGRRLSLDAPMEQATTVLSWQRHGALEATSARAPASPALFPDLSVRAIPVLLATPPEHAHSRSLSSTPSRASGAGRVTVSWPRHGVLEASKGLVTERLFPDIADAQRERRGGEESAAEALGAWASRRRSEEIRTSPNRGATSAGRGHSCLDKLAPKSELAEKSLRREASFAFWDRDEPRSSSHGAAAELPAPESAVVEVPVNSAVLAAHSRVLRECIASGFRNKGALKRRHLDIAIAAQDRCAFMRLLEFLYTGDIPSCACGVLGCPADYEDEPGPWLAMLALAVRFRISSCVDRLCAKLQRAALNLSPEEAEGVLEAHAAFPGHRALSALAASASARIQEEEQREQRVARGGDPARLRSKLTVASQPEMPPGVVSLSEAEVVSLLERVSSTRSEGAEDEKADAAFAWARQAFSTPRSRVQALARAVWPHLRPHLLSSEKTLTLVRETSQLIRDAFSTSPGAHAPKGHGRGQEPPPRCVVQASLLVLGCDLALASSRLTRRSADLSSSRGAAHADPGRAEAVARDLVESMKLQLVHAGLMVPGEGQRGILPPLAGCQPIPGLVSH